MSQQVRQAYEGLTAAQVAESRARHGANVLTPPKKESRWKRFFEKFTGPLGHYFPGCNDGDHLIFILEIAALLSVFIACSEYNGWLGMTRRGAGVFVEPLGILLAILLATGIAFIFELRADREFSLLNQVNDDERVQVIRDGNACTIAKRDVVVGDIVLINTGDEIPADGELLEAVSLHMDESSLTGEPSTTKSADPARRDKGATFPVNRVMRGTKVIDGHGVFRVTEVGDATEHGKVFVAAQIDSSVITPLNLQLNKLGALITRLSYGVAALVVLGRLLSYFVQMPFEWSDFLAYFLQTVMIAVTLIVVAVPEGLPMAVTLSLAYSMRRMLKTNNLVRKMHACETMGATTVICTDKTGTLTQNQMQVGNVLLPDDKAARALIATGMAVNSTAQLDMSHQRVQVVGNPTEGALLLWLHEQGESYLQLRMGVRKIAEIPFSTELKYMATLARVGDKDILFVKGAPEIVMDLCSGGLLPREDVNEALRQYNRQAMRTLAFAHQEVEPGEQVIVNGRLVARRLLLAGVVGISDPVRQEVPQAIEQCIHAGIDVKIVTGDNPEIAREIARQIGLWNDAVDGDDLLLTGTEFSALDDKEAARRAQALKIIARARPMDKKRLVELLQAQGQVVAVTGDGTNDAPALKTAHVGLSMGDGTAVAKEASDITIIDNSFSSIARAVMWGRSLYQNIQRFLLFQLTVNVVACLIVMLGAFFGTQSPLTVTQMLWVNLIMDTFAAMALASLPPSSQVMNNAPRRRSDFILTRRMRRVIVVVGLAFTALLMCMLGVLHHVTVTPQSIVWHAHLVKELTPYELTLFFTTFVMLQFWNMFNARSFATGRSAFHFKDCGEFLFIVVVIFVGQVLITTFGGDFFGVEPLSLRHWLCIIFVTSPVLLVGELHHRHQSPGKK